jgi:hypothetical protein
VYLGLFSGHGISAVKLSASEGDSPWAYLGFLLRDHGALLVPIALGLPSLTRRLGNLQRAWFAGVGFALLGLVPLSVPAAKEPLYMAPALPFFYGFAALCLIAPDYTPARYLRIDRAAAKFSIAIACALVIASLSRVLAAHTEAVLLSLLHCAHVAIWTVPSFRVLQQKPVKPAIVACALLSLIVALAWLAAGSGALLR